MQRPTRLSWKSWKYARTAVTTMTRVSEPLGVLGLWWFPGHVHHHGGNASAGTGPAVRRRQQQHGANPTPRAVAACTTWRRYGRCTRSGRNRTSTFTSVVRTTRVPS
uniref:(northern house mosquito) hypothetical protein n=1 Tax=Culex pipiens TaxID=7175 RepID=A0A8D8F5N1_CULPI